MNTITFDLNKDEAEDLLFSLRYAVRDGFGCESVDCMIETIEDFLQ